jgi:hypothetical protein
MGRYRNNCKNVLVYRLVYIEIFLDLTLTANSSPSTQVFISKYLSPEKGTRNDSRAETEKIYHKLGASCSARKC